MDAPDLIIPVRMDTSKVVQGLQSMGQAGHKTADDISRGMGQARDHTGRFTASTHEAASSLKGAGIELSSFIRMQAGLGMMKSAANALGSEFRQMSEYIGQTSREFQAFRKSLSGAASLSGKPNTNAYAASQIDAAEKARVTPDEFKNLNQAFMAKASTYVGAGPEAKMSEADAADFQAALAEYAKNKGVSQEEMGSFAGGLLAQRKGKTTAADMKAQAAKVFATLEASSADVKHLLPMQTRVMAQGLGAEESASVLAAAPEYAPEEEGTYVLRAIAATREIEQKGKGQQYGIEKGQSQYEKLKGLVGNLQQRQAAGEDMDKVLHEIAPEHVSQQALRGMINVGGAEGLDKWRRMAESTPTDAMDKVNREARTTEQGRQNAVESRLEVEKARLGLRNDPLERRRQIAETEAIAGGEFERPTTAAEWAVENVPGADDHRNQVINRQMIRRARAELGESSGVGDMGRAINRGKTDELMRELLPRIESQGFEALKKRREAAMGELEESGVDVRNDPRKDERVNLRAIQDARMQAHQPMASSDAMAARDKGSTDALLRTLIATVEEQTRAMERQHKETNQPKLGPPLPAPMPRPAGR